MAMNTYTGWQYLLIDAANQAGHDKLTFEDRIDWATKNLPILDSTSMVYNCPAKERPLYLKAVMAIRKAQRGEPMGHLVGLDACCSGMQLMSVLTGCISGAAATGLVDPDKRMDAYGEVTNAINGILGSVSTVPREYAKKATMTAFYGSKLTPKMIFGEDTPELGAFYQAMHQVAPGAWELLQDLLASWQAGALVHSWKLPDGYDARVKVMERKEARIEVDELNHASFTYEFYENRGTEKGLANAANVVHSVDAYVLREMHRRCNYDQAKIKQVLEIMEKELRNPQEILTPAGKLGYYIEQYERSTVASTAILAHVNTANVTMLDSDHLMILICLCRQMLEHKPFELITVHDEFKAHPNNLNQVRSHYREILAELAESTLIDDLLSQIHGKQGTFTKLSQPGQLSALIRKSNYALS